MASGCAQQSRDTGQVADLFVDGFTHQTTGVVVVENPLPEVGRLQEGHGGPFVGCGEFDLGDPDLRSGFDLRFAKSFEFQQQPPDIFLDHGFVQIQLAGRGANEGQPRRGLAEIERIEMDQVFTGGQHVDPQLMGAEIVFQATNAIVARFDGDVQIGSTGFDGEVARVGAGQPVGAHLA